MTPIQKAKEITRLFNKHAYFSNQDDQFHDEKFDKWATTAQADALLSGDKNEAEAIAQVIYTNVIDYGRKGMPPTWKEYSKTIEGKALIGSVLSGEDWKEDGKEPINIDFNTRVVVTDNKGRTRKYKLVEVDY